MDLPRHAPLGPWRQVTERFRLAGLIPEGDAGEEVRPLDVPRFFGHGPVAFVLHRHLQRAGEVDRVQDVPAIADAFVAGAPALPARLAEPDAGTRSEAPGVVEVVLGAGALQ